MEFPGMSHGRRQKETRGGMKKGTLLPSLFPPPGTQTPLGTPQGSLAEHFVFKALLPPLPPLPPAVCLLLPSIIVLPCLHTVCLSLSTSDPLDDRVCSVTQQLKCYHTSVGCFPPPPVLTLIHFTSLLSW